MSLPTIYGMDNPTPQTLARAVADGNRLVFFEYCISLVAASLRRPTGIHLVPADRVRLPGGWRYTILSLLLGWWGIPWGLIYTPLVIITNLSGGCDVTEEVCAQLAEANAAEPAPNR
jgi:hypothetical protein